jgi:nitrate reductase (cytochrome), electron transfer subunit
MHGPSSRSGAEEIVSMPYGEGKPHYKATRIVMAMVVVVSASGYFMGLRHSTSHVAPGGQPSTQATLPFATLESGKVPAARRYSEMSLLPKANSGWSNVITRLAQATNDLFATVTNTEAQRAETILARATRRAYDGAPPVVPHPIDQSSAFACLSCHGEGKIVKGKIASKVSHATYGNCTQCHVPATGGGILAGGEPLLERLAENAFAGNSDPVKGTRAFVGSPPTIPHPTLMRTDCMSCHRPNGSAGIRTTHAYRQSCTQCHAPSAVLDQRQLLTAELPRVDLPAIGGLE